MHAHSVHDEYKDDSPAGYEVSFAQRKAKPGIFERDDEGETVVRSTLGAPERDPLDDPHNIVDNEGQIQYGWHPTFAQKPHRHAKPGPIEIDENGEPVVRSHVGQDHIIEDEWEPWNRVDKNSEIDYTHHWRQGNIEGAADETFAQLESDPHLQTYGTKLAGDDRYWLDKHYQREGLDDPEELAQYDFNPALDEDMLRTKDSYVGEENAQLGGGSFIPNKFLKVNGY